MPPPPKLPRHVAIIMDGNGRWAQKRFLPRYAGHRAGVKSVRQTVEHCGELGIDVLTLFAFSSENWRRPAKEVGMLMNLFMKALKREVRNLHNNNVRFRLIGAREDFSPPLQEQIRQAEALTKDNSGLTLQIAANYGGRWDILQAVSKLLATAQQDSQFILSEQALTAHLSFSALPEPDLFIRTGGERRISNFILWQLAYTELYFTDVLWPDFNRAALQAALDDFSTRQRRFGRTGDQVEAEAHSGRDPGAVGQIFHA